MGRNATVSRVRVMSHASSQRQTRPFGARPDGPIKAYMQGGNAHATSGFRGSRCVRPKASQEGGGAGARCGEIYARPTPRQSDEKISSQNWRDQQDRTPANDWRKGVNFRVAPTLRAEESLFWCESNATKAGAVRMKRGDRHHYNHAAAESCILLGSSTGQGSP